jgi:mono/diheme cytochrome c family protein
MRRKRIPYWALPVVALLPLWAFLYQWSLTPPSSAIAGPLAEGEELYTANCASCHLPTGDGSASGGIGQQLSGGEVLLTFPDIADQISFVMTGSDPYIGQPYGDPNRPGGPRIGKAGMPPWEDILTAEELNAVVCYERVVLSGEDPVPASCTVEGAAGGATEEASSG